MAAHADQPEDRSRSLRDRVFTRPTRERRRQLLRRQIVVVALVLNAVALFGRVWPQHYEVTASPGIYVAWAAFMVATLSFQLGVAALFVVVRSLVARFWLGAALTIPLSIFLVVLPMLRPPSGDRPSDDHAPSGRVMTVNLLVGNPDRAAVARDILAADPDVIVLQEYDPKWHRTLHAKLGTRYPYEVHETRDDSFGSAIYSRTPFVGPAPEPFTLAQNETPQYRAVVHLAGRDVAIYDVHLMPPVSRDYVITGRHEFADLRRRVRRERLPMILAGDLNVSASSPQHHDLGDAGLIDAWELVRHGRGATWPATRGINWLPGVRLDHLYLSGELTTTRVRVGDANGSDHRPVVADVVAARARSMQRVAVAAVDERRAVRAEARVELAGCGAGATCAAEGEQAEGQGADDRGKWLHGRSPSR